MKGQLSLLPIIMDGEDVDDLKRQVEELQEYAKNKRKWENAFQEWSNNFGIKDDGGYEDYGCCGYGSMCDWCEDNSYGRPCVRALNSMLREKGKSIDYLDFDFVKVWRGVEA